MRFGLLVAVLGGVIIFVGIFYFNEDSSFLRSPGSFFNSATTTDSEVVESEEETEAAELPPKSTQSSTQNTVVPTKTTPVLPAPTVPQNTQFFVIVYSNTGFFPSEAEVPAGQTLQFLNASDRPLWVTTDNHPSKTQPFYPEFDQGKSIAKGELYTFTITKTGAWGYYNLNNEAHTATISVGLSE